MEVFEGNPLGKWVWANVWDLPALKRGKQGEPCTFGDIANIFRTNIEQIYGGEPSVDGCPLAEGELANLQAGTMFLGLQAYYKVNGPAYKLCFGPKSFIVISDPVMCRHILRDNAKAYDKGVLAEILEPIMGKGLIPADPETWKVRRRAIVPGFHKAWLNAMINLFADCNDVLIGKLDDYSKSQEVIEMESHYCSVSLDIIGKSIFNYDFGSVTNESPVIKAVYSVLKEAEHRSMTPAPYWDIPGANSLVPRLRKFNGDMRLLNDVLDDLINRAKDSRQELDLEDLQARNYDKVTDASMLRFLVDLRGEDVSNKQLRDDLMTMLIAGHETTAAVLTWATFELAQRPEVLAKAQAEVDRVLGDRRPTLDDIKQMEYIRFIVAESLRMYPEPPLLIRRALEDDVLPKGSGEFQPKIPRGADIFMAIYNIHRSPEFWENPDEFDPDRFKRPFTNPGVEGWAGFNPAAMEGQLYPNEVASDFAFLPFGGGQRKCVGDQFATMEAVVTIAMLLRRFEFKLAVRPEEVGFFTGATIHTRNGLPMTITRRQTDKAPAAMAEPQAASAA
ncbi:cytochrome P450 [Tribonema minus]|uniref:Cytochrome P450 n=1 Tax=Tribonema minus TaxID=303371 RepID=A0A835YXB3_9STRA|nr:cytochrome P450 [Tribonema minus]